MQRETYYVVRLDAPHLEFVCALDASCTAYASGELRHAHRWAHKVAALEWARNHGAAHVLKVNVDAREEE